MIFTQANTTTISSSSNSFSFLSTMFFFLFSAIILFSSFSRVDSLSSSAASASQSPGTANPLCVAVPDLEDSIRSAFVNLAGGDFFPSSTSCEYIF